MTLANIIEKGMNNPDCAFFTGSFLGSSVSGYKVLLGIFALYGIKTFFLVFITPGATKLKDKIWKNNKERGA